MDVSRVRSIWLDGSSENWDGGDLGAQMTFREGARIRLPGEHRFVVVEIAQQTQDGGWKLLVDEVGLPRKVLLTADQASAVEILAEDGSGDSSAILAAFWAEWMRRAALESKATALASTTLDPRPTAVTTGCWRPPWTPSAWSGCCPSGQWCTWTPAMTTSPAGRSWPNAEWSPRSPRGASRHRSRRAAGGDRAHPCLGQSVRQAALVHRAASAGGGVLAGIGQRRHRLWPAAPPRLDLLPLAGSPSPMTTHWRRPLGATGHELGDGQGDLLGAFQDHQVPGAGEALQAGLRDAVGQRVRVLGLDRAVLAAG
jgi:hypothetical protein